MPDDLLSPRVRDKGFRTVLPGPVRENARSISEGRLFFYPSKVWLTAKLFELDIIRGDVGL